VFDWDEDQDDLVASKSVPAAPQPTTFGLQKVLGPVLVVIVIAAYAYEKGMIAPPRAEAGLAFSQIPRAPLVQPSPDRALLVYSDAQAEAFLRGLRALDGPSLQAYAAHTHADIAHASQGLRPYFQDVQVLLAEEAARRAQPPLWPG
jgi:hypothetical protein